MKLCFRVGCALLFFAATAMTFGAEWRRVSTGTLAWFRSVYFVDQNLGYVGGGNGTLLRTRDGGRSWERVALRTKDTILDIHFVDEVKGWLLCEGGRVVKGEGAADYLLRTDDGGRSFTQVEIGRDRPERLTRMVFGPTNGMLVGEGGFARWVPNAFGKGAETLLPDRYLIMDGSFLGGSRVVLVGGGGSIYFSDDGGLGWRSAIFKGTRPSTKFNAVHFPDAELGWAVGNQGSIYFTTNGGRSWASQSSGVESALLDVVFVDHLRGFAVGENGIILATLDGGKGWVRQQSGVKHRLESLAVAGGRAFAVGYGGTMLVSELNNILPTRTSGVYESMRDRGANK